MLKELEDYNWFPAVLRRWQMDFIGSIVVWTKLYFPLVSVLQSAIAVNKIEVWQDVCSGSGTPAVFMHQQLKSEISLMLSDKYPNTSFINQRQFTYSPEKIDCLELQVKEHTLYTLFNAFHHFTGEEQNSIVKKMIEGNAPFIIGEILQPGLFTVLKIIFTTVIVQLLVAPFIKPFSFTRLFFTYIIPVNLFTITYDGIISVLKSKTQVQYQQQFQHFSSDIYGVTVNKISSLAGSIIYIKGTPLHT